MCEEPGMAQTILQVELTKVFEPKVNRVGLEHGGQTSLTPHRQPWPHPWNACGSALHNGGEKDQHMD